MTSLKYPKNLAFKRYDRYGMLEIIEALPEQCAEAVSIGARFKLPKGFRSRYKNIVITGLGGSAIGADILRSYVAGEIRVPFFVNRHYRLPNFVDKDSLVIVSSYSGNTEETLSAYKDAGAKSARRLVITSGGKLGVIAKRDNVPVISIPGGLPPRCALGFSFFPLLITLSKLGMIKDKTKDISQTISLLGDIRRTRLGGRVSGRKNTAKSIASALYGKYPVVYGGQDNMDSVVTRWRGQFEENAKTLATTHLFPEMDHNEIMGWENPKKLLKDFVVIILRDRSDHPRVAKRMDVTKKVIEMQGVKVIEVYSMGKDLLSRIFSLVYIGDLTSYYLAMMNRVDPTPVERIEYLKKELARD